jgi:hypothetical protein
MIDEIVMARQNPDVESLMTWEQLVSAASGLPHESKRELVHISIPSRLRILRNHAY